MLQEDEMVGLFLRDKLVILLTGESLGYCTLLVYGKEKDIGEGSTV